MNVLASATRPFVYLLTWSTDGLLRLMQQTGRDSPKVTEEEIQAVLLEGSAAGIIDRSEHHMVRNVFRLDDRPIGSLMVPRAEIDWLDLNRPVEESLQRIVTCHHSRFPVCRGSMDDVVGIAAVKQVLKQSLSGKSIDLAEGLESAVFVPESLTGLELLEQFRVNYTQMVFVIDEYGELLGLVTLQDILAAVAGEFQSRDPEDAWAVQREDGSWLLDGLIRIPELKDRLSLRAVPEEERGRYHTLSGMLLWLLGRVPQTGDRAEWEGWRMEVVDMDGRRIDKVLATAISPPEAEGDEGRTGVQGKIDASGRSQESS